MNKIPDLIQYISDIPIKNTDCFQGIGHTAMLTNRWKLLVIIILGIFTLYSCNTSEYEAPSTATVPVDTTAPTVTITPITTPTSSEEPQISVPEEVYRALPDLDCSSHLETRWGVEPTEFGYVPQSTDSEKIQGPYPPAFNELGEMFIADWANNRVLRYPKDSHTPKVILVPAHYVDDEAWFRWERIRVSNDRIFLIFFTSFTTPHGTKGIKPDLGVLSFDGQEERVIDLKTYFPYFPHLSSDLFVDRSSDVFILLFSEVGYAMVHYDADLEPENAEFRSLGWSIDPMNLSVGWDNNLYNYDRDDDVLNNWGAADTSSFFSGETNSSLAGMRATAEAATQLELYSPHLLGIDTQERIYLRFKIREIRELLYFRFDSFGNLDAIGKVPEEWSIGLSLSPDGGFYGIEYDSEDPSVQPQIIQCIFRDG